MSLSEHPLTHPVSAVSPKQIHPRSLARLSYIFFIIYFNWRIIILQYCGDFCHTSTRIQYLATLYTALWSLEQGDHRLGSTEILGYSLPLELDSGARAALCKPSPLGDTHTLSFWPWFSGPRHCLSALPSKLCFSPSAL